MTNKFEGKVAVILGGSTGDWPRCSKAVCSRRQDHVFIEGRRKDPLDAAVAEIGRKATGLKGDVANLADLDRLYESVKGQDRKIDVILPNAEAAQLPAFGTVQQKFYCSATRRFAEAHVYKQGLGVVARCAVCKHVVLRLVTSGLR